MQTRSQDYSKECRTAGVSGQKTDFVLKWHSEHLLSGRDILLCDGEAYHRMWLTNAPAYRDRKRGL